MNLLTRWTIRASATASPRVMDELIDRLRQQLEIPPAKMKICAEVCSADRLRPDVRLGLADVGGGASRRGLSMSEIAAGAAAPSRRRDRRHPSR